MSEPNLRHTERVASIIRDRIEIPLTSDTIRGYGRDIWEAAEAIVLALEEEVGPRVQVPTVWDIVEEGEES